MDHSILIIGGYGKVGQEVSRTLAPLYPGRIIVAGRRLAASQSMARTLGHDVRAMQLDINALPEPATYLEQVGTVISCIERTNDQLVRACLARGIHFTEVGASFDKLDEIIQLRAAFPQSTSSVIASTGLIPGISAVLAAHLAGPGAEIDRVNTHVMLGVGDEHGADAIRWMQASLNSRFTIQTPEGPRAVNSLADPQIVRFFGDRMGRRSYRFDFADQHTIPETLRAGTASSYLCFDSRLATTGLWLLRRLGLAPLLKRISPHRIARILESLPMGSDRFALQARVWLKGDSVPRQGEILGYNEAHATGVITALTGQLLHEGRIPRGIHYLETVSRLEDFSDALVSNDLTLRLPEDQAKQELINGQS